MISDVYAVGVTKPELMLGDQPGVMFDIVQADNQLVAFLFVFRPNPEQGFIDRFQSAKKVGLALKYERSQILLAVKVGMNETDDSVMGWDDCIYDPFKSVQVDIRDIKRPCEENVEEGLSTFLINVFLVDPTIGKICAYHLITPDQEMNDALKRTIRNKINRGQDDPAKFKKTMMKIYEEYPTAADIAKQADAVCWI